MTQVEHPARVTGPALNTNVARTEGDLIPYNQVLVNGISKRETVQVKLPIILSAPTKEG